MLFTKPRLVMLVLAMSLAALPLLVRGPESVEPLAVAIGVWPGAETLVVARERGLLPADDVTLVEMTWDSAGVRALGNRVVDAAVLSLDEVQRLRESGYEVRVVLVFDQSMSGDALLAGAEVGSVAGLRGKRVGVDLKAAGMWLLAAALEAHGMGLQDVTAVPMSPQDMGDALAARKVDAIVSVEPWLARVKSGGLNVLFESREAVVPVTRVLVTFADVAKAQRARLAKLVKAHFEMLKIVQSSAESEPGLEVVLRRERTDAAGFRRSLGGLRWMSLDENRQWLRRGDTTLKRMGGEVEQRMRAAGLIQGQVRSVEWTDDSFLPAP